jgi:hypothetical protein
MSEANNKMFYYMEKYHAKVDGKDCYLGSTSKLSNKNGGRRADRAVHIIEEVLRMLLATISQPRLSSTTAKWK